MLIGQSELKICKREVQSPAHYPSFTTILRVYLKTTVTAKKKLKQDTERFNKL